ncbi:hypothetical protein [Azospirillum thermophilum]|uniref:hypothetical protein n=1 Tax=Azospirillum thermophilum TaxID=2202148 RepID=UPI001FE6E8D2|nr:hypothetical protein [Azospirillum thermophilum]
MDEMMRRLDRALFPALSGRVLQDGLRRGRTLALLAAVAAAGGLGLAACEGPRHDPVPRPQSPAGGQADDQAGDWRAVGMLTKTADQGKFCALRPVPPDMPDLGIDKAWRIQCDMLPPIPGKLVHRRSPPGWQATEDDLKQMLTKGAWATHGMALLDCTGKTPEVKALGVGGSLRGAVLECEVKSSSLSTLASQTHPEPESDSSPASEWSGDIRAVTAFAVPDGEGIHLGYVEQGRIGACNSGKDDSVPAVQAVLDRARNVDQGRQEECAGKLKGFIGNETQWRKQLEIAGAYHDFGLYSNAAGNYSDANLTLFTQKGVHDPSRADVLLQLALNLSNTGQIKSAKDTLEEAESLLWDIDPSVSGGGAPSWKRVISDVLLPLKAHHYCVVHGSNEIAASSSAEGSDRESAVRKKIGDLIASSKTVENTYCEFIAEDGALKSTMPRQPSSCSCGNLSKNRPGNAAPCPRDVPATPENDPWSHCTALLRGRPAASAPADRPVPTLENRVFLDPRIPQARYALSEMLYHRSLLEDVGGNADEADRLRRDARRLLVSTGLAARSTEARLRQASARSHLAAGNTTSALSDVAFALKTLEGLKPAPETPVDEPAPFKVDDVGAELRRLPQAEARLVFLAAQALDLAGIRGRTARPWRPAGSCSPKRNGCSTARRRHCRRARCRMSCIALPTASAAACRIMPSAPISTISTAISNGPTVRRASPCSRRCSVSPSFRSWAGSSCAGRPPGRRRGPRSRPTWTRCATACKPSPNGSTTATCRWTGRVRPCIRRRKGNSRRNGTSWRRG